MGLSDQNRVVDLMNGERYVISSKLGLFPRRNQFGLSQIVCSSDLEQIRQRLGDLGSAGRKIFATLVEDHVHRGKRRSETSGLYLNQLRLGRMHEGAVVSD